MPQGLLRLFIFGLLATIGASGPSAGSITLRVRLPSGETKRVVADAKDSIAAVRARAQPGHQAMDPASTFLDPRFQDPADDAAEVGSLGLESGALLYCRPSSGVTAAAKVDAFAARAKSGKSATKAKSWEALSKEAAGLKAERQKAPNCTSLSLSAAAAQDLAAYLASPGRQGSDGGDDGAEATKPRRVGLLYGRQLPAKGGAAKGRPGADGKEGQYHVVVEAIWEPPQPGATGASYDARALAKAANSGCPASRVANALGLRLVGWVFSHPPREESLTADEVLVTAALRRAVAAKHGDEAGAGLVVVAARDTTADPAATARAEEKEKEKATEAEKRRATSKGGAARGGPGGEEKVTFEAYQVSNQCFAWLADGTLDQMPSPGEPPKRDAAGKGSGGGGESASCATLAGAATLTTSKPVTAEGKETREVDVALFVVPVPIVTHRGAFASAFPPPNRPERKPSPRILKRAIFGAGAGGVLSRLTDFHLLLYLEKRLSDPGGLLKLVKASSLDQGKGDAAASATFPPYYLTILEQLCGGDA